MGDTGTSTVLDLDDQGCKSGWMLMIFKLRQRRANSCQRLAIDYRQPLDCEHEISCCIVANHISSRLILIVGPKRLEFIPNWNTRTHDLAVRQLPITNFRLSPAVNETLEGSQCNGPFVHSFKFKGQLQIPSPFHRP